MKSLFLGFMCLLAMPVVADSLMLQDEVNQLGVMSGLAMACGESNKKLDDYELIASRIIANKSATEEIELQMKKEFILQQLKTLQKYQVSPISDCPNVLKRFRQMPLFQSTVYSDGGIKFSDGTYLPPLRPFKIKKK